MRIRSAVARQRRAMPAPATLLTARSSPRSVSGPLYISAFGAGFVSMTLPSMRFSALLADVLLRNESTDPNRRLASGEYAVPSAWHRSLRSRRATGFDVQPACPLIRSTQRKHCPVESCHSNLLQGLFRLKIEYSMGRLLGASRVAYLLQYPRPSSALR